MKVKGLLILIIIGFLSICLSLLGVKVTEFKGVEVWESKDKYEGKMTTFYIYYFDQFSGNANTPQISLYIIDNEEVKDYRFVIVSIDKNVPDALILIVDGEEILMPLATFEQNTSFIGSGVSSIRQTDNNASYICTKEMRTQISQAAKIEIRILNDQATLMPEDTKNLKALFK